MIVRIAGEGRWRIADGRARELLAEDLRLLRAVDDECEVDYRYQLLALCRYVRQHGQRLPSVARGADLTIPSPEMTLAETVELLAERSGL
ncbi:MAG: hypothetical protein M3Q31_13055 [Actinomycetota bacterium]|nr:hypothetical protein [Actinomycetota bacterium]